MHLSESALFVIRHTPEAAGAALLFGAGALASLPVLRRRVGWLLVLPRWFARLVARVLAARVSHIGLAGIIFGFNGSAMSVYMLSGLVPGLPAAIAFATGLNVALAAMLGAAGSLERPAQPLPTSGRVCAALTFLLELPCFWYSIGMGWSLRVNVLDLWRGAGWKALVEPVRAYVVVILPILAVSALVESHAVSSARRVSDS